MKYRIIDEDMDSELFERIVIGENGAICTMRWHDPTEEIDHPHVCMETYDRVLDANDKWCLENPFEYLGEYSMYYQEFAHTDQVDDPIVLAEALAFVGINDASNATHDAKLFYPLF